MVARTDSAKLLTRLSSLEKRFDGLFSEIDSLRCDRSSDQKFKDLEDAHAELIEDHSVLNKQLDQLRIELSTHNNSLRDLQLTTSRLVETAERIKLIESELKSLRETLIRYEMKFASLEQLKSLLWTLLVAVVPATVSAAVELTKFIMSLH